jgi:nucleoside-diphosphate-sugar epimerase
MDVVIAGGHGQIALRLARLLSARGERVRALIRNPDHGSDVSSAGAEAVVFDLEKQSSAELASVVAGADAVVFAAGAGPGSGAARKRTVDLGGAVKLIEAAQASGVRRYVIVSSIGADDPASGSEAMRPYLEAKAQADAAVVASGLDWTIVRPGHLTDEPGTARVTVGERVGYADVPRDDVAAVIAGVLDEPRTIGRTFVVVEGETPIPDALRQLCDESA